MTSALRGFWSTTGDTRVVEAAAAVGPDFICVDTQHGVDLANLSPGLFTVMAHYEVPGIVRVGMNHPAPIGRALDLGASGVMVPMVDSAADAKRAVDALAFAPEGTRSYGMQTPRVNPLDSGYRPFVAIQIETREALDDLDEIAAIEGVDWLYIGPADLGLAVCGVSAGNVSQVFDGEHPHAGTMRDAFAAVVEAARRHGKRAGLHTTTAESTRVAEENGFTVSAVAGDLSEIARGLASSLETLRSG